MTSDDISALSIEQLAQAYRSGAVTPVAATEAAFERIERVDGRLNSFVTLTRDLALQQARQAQDELARGLDRGPLQGIPIGLKDLYATRGIRTTAHSKVLLDWVPDEDAACTERLYQAGAVLLGKLAMHEFAWGAPGFDNPFPPARNPWDLERSPSGSSSGSGAALAARLCAGALGSDTGGSIRGPAHVCGITGLKTTYGLVSRHGVVPLAWSLDTCGPMARTVEDCAILLDAIAGYDPRDPASVDRPKEAYRAALDEATPRPMRIGVPRGWIDQTEGVDADVRAAFEAALDELRRAGATVVDVDGQPFLDARIPHMVTMLAEAYAYHEADLKTRPQDFGAGPRTRLYEASVLTAADYIQAQRVRSAIVRRIHELFDTVDAIVTPGGAKPAVRFEEYVSGSSAPGPVSFTGAFNLYGGPAIVVPCGFSAGSLPIGLQIAGRAFDEVGILRIAQTYQHTTDWHLRAPQLEEVGATQA